MQIFRVAESQHALLYTKQTQTSSLTVYLYRMRMNFSKEIKMIDAVESLSRSNSYFQKILNPRKHRPRYDLEFK